MRIFGNLVGKRTKLLLTAGLLFCLTSCVTLRDADSVPLPPTPEETAAETQKPSEYDFSRPETEEIPPVEEVFPEVIREIPDGALEWIGWYEDTYGVGSSERVLLDAGSIRAWNQKMIADTPTMRDMSVLPETMSGQEVLDLIHRYELPADERYDGGQQYITPEMREEVKNNRALDNIGETVAVRRAIAVERSNLKGFPTSRTFHKPGDRHYDGIQETEILSGFPVGVVHESADGAFVFVLSYFYSGWIPSETIAYCTEEDYNNFASPEDFVTVLSKTADIGGVRFDMGAVLPYVTEDASAYTVEVPRKNATTGAFYTEKATVDKTDAARGYLDYTMENYYRQAFLYLGTYYGWGGSDGGVDCSGFVCAVFRTFGLYLPRNTGEQSRHAGMLLSLSNDPSGVLDTVRQPAAVYRPGHVMLYLGKKDGSHYIIHAPQGGEQVSVAVLSMANLTGVSVFG